MHRFFPISATSAPVVTVSLAGPPRCTAFDTNADAFEISLVRGSILAGIPLLGICRGVQVMNIALGGTLVQDFVRAPVVGSTMDRRR